MLIVVQMTARQRLQSESETDNDGSVVVAHATVVVEESGQCLGWLENDAECAGRGCLSRDDTGNLRREAADEEESFLLLM